MLAFLDTLITAEKRDCCVYWFCLIHISILWGGSLFYSPDTLLDTPFSLSTLFIRHDVSMCVFFFPIYTSYITSHH